MTVSAPSGSKRRRVVSSRLSGTSRGASEQRSQTDRDVQEEDVLPSDVAGEHATGDQADRGAGGRDAAPQAERLVALGALREHVHHDRQRRRQHDRRTCALQAAHHDQERVAAGQPAGQRCRGEDRQAEP